MTLCRTHGVTRFACGSWSAEFSEDHRYSIFKEETPVKHEFSKEPGTHPASEDEIMFWSAGGSEVKDTEGNPLEAA